MVNQMHGKQMVIKRKYELPNKEMHPSSVWPSDWGGFSNFSTFGGHSRLLTSHIFRMIAATSAVRPLHSSHRGDSGITNLLRKKNYEKDTTTKKNWLKKLDCVWNVELFTIKSKGIRQEWRYTVAKFGNLVLDMQFQK